LILWSVAAIPAWLDGGCDVAGIALVAQVVVERVLLD